MIIVVGRAVDYTVHLMHSYSEAGAPARYQKAQTALTEMGVSVVSGALTTMGAALPLLLAQFKFFTQFGNFIAIITFCSIAWAILYLMGLAMVCGPQGTDRLWCDIPLVKFWMRCKAAPNAAGANLIDGDNMVSVVAVGQPEVRIAAKPSTPGKQKGAAGGAPPLHVV